MNKINIKQQQQKQKKVDSEQKWNWGTDNINSVIWFFGFVKLPVCLMRPPTWRAPWW